jgi:filamentous hemagglutinin family protein
MKSYWFGFSTSLPIWVLLRLTSPILAEVVQDGTLPHSSSVTLDGNTAVITGGTQARRNLFHSFREFSVGRGQTASFRGVDRSIVNIFSRVTGPEASRINGRIEVLQANGTVSPANLFLLNPNGIIFGRHASLNIGGSFLATTASRINFADGNRFSATAPQSSPLLTVSVPTGLQFGHAPGSIVDRSTAPVLDRSGNPILDTSETPARGLNVAANRTLALVGGDVTLPGGRLFTAGGRIELGSVDTGQVSLTAIPTGWDLRYEGISDFGNIHLSHQAQVETSGGRGGAIEVQGSRLSLRGSSQMISQTQGTQPGRPISVNASDSVEAIGNSTDGQSPSGLFTQTNGTGTAGTLSIQAPRLQIQAGAQVGSTTFAGGRAGNVQVQAIDVELDGSALDKKGKPILLGSALLGPSSLITSTDGSSSGNAGSLTVTTQRLRLSGGANLNAAAGGSGNAGDLIVRARDSVEVSGIGTAIQAASNGTFRPGFRPGVIQLATGDLIVRDQARITARSINLSGTGAAGNLEIQARTVLLDNQGQLSTVTQSGNGGDIRLQVQDLLLLRRGSGITATAGVGGAGGNGGNITINAEDGFVVATPLENNDIGANAGSGSGGRIEVTTLGVFGLQRRTLAELQRLLNQDDPTQLFPFDLPTSDLTAISQTSPSLSGEVILNTLDLDPSRGLVELPTNFADASTLIARTCPARNNVPSDRLSEFVVTGRGGLPPSPTDLHSSEAVLTEWAGLNSEANPDSNQRQEGGLARGNAPIELSSSQSPIVEAQGWRMDAAGKVILVAQSPGLPHQSGFPIIQCEN